MTTEHNMNIVLHGNMYAQHGAMQQQNIRIIKNYVLYILS